MVTFINNKHLFLFSANPRDRRDTFHIFMFLFPADFADNRRFFTHMTKNGYTNKMIKSCKNPFERGDIYFQQRAIQFFNGTQA